MVAIFANRCLKRRILSSNLGGIDPEKLYRATLKPTPNERMRESGVGLSTPFQLSEGKQKE